MVMITFGIIFALILMGVMASMALNKKSIFPVRIASLIALAVMVITVLICLFIVLTDNRVIIDPSNVIVGAEIEVPKTSSTNVMILLFMIVLLLGLFGIITFHSLKEHRKNNSVEKNRFSL